MHERFEPDRVNHAIDHDRVTIISVVSTMLERMLADRGDRPFPNDAALRPARRRAGALPLLERALALGAPVFQSYGLTETASQVATLAPEDVRSKVGSAGKPLMGTQVRIEADGEILVRGPTVSPGYLHQPPHGEWLRTGDLGYLDDEGYLFVLDRRDDLIVSGGENVYPAEVEAALLAHPAVEEVGVFGMPDASGARSCVPPSNSRGAGHCRRAAGVLSPAHRRVQGSAHVAVRGRRCHARPLASSCGANCGRLPAPAVDDVGGWPMAALERR